MEVDGKIEGWCIFSFPVFAPDHLLICLLCFRHIPLYYMFPSFIICFPQVYNIVWSSSLWSDSGILIIIHSTLCYGLLQLYFLTPTKIPCPFTLIIKWFPHLAIHPFLLWVQFKKMSECHNVGIHLDSAETVCPSNIKIAPVTSILILGLFWVCLCDMTLILWGHLS